MEDVKNTIRLLFAVSVICVTAVPLHAQWVQTNGPYGGNVTCFAVSGTTMYAGTDDWPIGGVFRSTDHGSTWTEAGYGLMKSRVFALAVLDRYLFAGTDKGIFRSSDDGTSWSQVWNHVNCPVYSLVVDSSSLFAGTHEGVFRSDDSGLSWTGVNTGYTEPFCLVVFGTNIFAGNSTGIFRSSDHGAHWTAVNAGLPEFPVVNVLAVFDTMLCAGIGYRYIGNDGGLYRWSENGTRWTEIGPGMIETDVLALAVTRTDLFAGTSRGVKRSTDNGAHWKDINIGLINTQVNVLFVSGAQIFAGTAGGIFRSTNNGDSWVPVNSGLVKINVQTIAVAASPIRPVTILLAGTDGGVVFRSTDNGGTWTESSTGLTNAYIRSLGLFGTDLFAGTGWYNETNISSGGIFHSADLGATWAAVNAGIPMSGHDTTKYVLIDCFASIGSTIFAGSCFGGVFRSTDNGSTWSPISTGLPGGGVRALAADGASLYSGMLWSEITGIPIGPVDVISHSFGVFHSTDNGTRWIAANEGWPTMLNVSALAVSDTNVFAGTGAGVFRSADNGKNWIWGDTTGWTDKCVNALVFSGAYLFAGTGNRYEYPHFNGGVMFSRDNGTHWVNTGLTGVYVNALAISGNYLVAGTNNGVWRRPLSEIVTSVELSSSPLPDRFMLEQNFPNPFNPRTTIQYSIPHGGWMQLKIFNVLGREVATLVNEVKQPGTYTVQWDASGMPSGVYYYRMQAGTYTKTRRLILLK